MSHRTNPSSIPPRVQNIITGETSSAKELLLDFLEVILPKIGRELTRELLINLHQLVIGIAASMVLNLRGGRNVHLVLKMTSEEYTA